jgi:RNA polymerase sigma factor (sigma-70 family)
MATHAEQLMHYLRRLAAAPTREQTTDAALVDRFVRGKDEEAFAALVNRHAPMVLGVCRRVLRDAHDAEDAAQATFLVLARKASTLRRPDALAAWLHRTAHHLALLSRRSATRRQDREAQSFRAAPPRSSSDPLDELSVRELLAILDEEVQQLPEVYRLPLILCCLEGRTAEEAARQLGWTSGSVRGRLMRGRARLHHRFVLRGLTLSAALVVLGSVSGNATAGVPAGFLTATLRAAALFAAKKGSADTCMATSVLAIAEEGVRTMTVCKSKLALALLLTVSGLTLLPTVPVFQGGVGPPVITPVANAEETSPPLFRDVTAQAGIHFSYRNGEEADQYTILESLGGGVVVLDYDGDGLLDLFVTGGGYFAGRDKHQIKGHPCKLYRNRGQFRFEDVTAKAGLDRIAFYTHGAAVADFDNDGWPDLLVTGWHHLALFHNEPVDPKDASKGRRLVDVSKEAGFPDGLWTTSAAWGDLDGDGYPDLYVCQYVDWSLAGNHPTGCKYDGKTRDICPPKQFVGLEHKLFRNLGNGKFWDVSKEAGLRVKRTDEELQQLQWLSPKARERLKRDVKEGDARFGKGLGVLMVDVNGDGKPDIYVANDTVDNFLYLNRATRLGEMRLEEMSMASGTARDDTGAPNGSRGLAAADVFGTGQPALLVTNYEYEQHALYLNQCTDERIVFIYRSSSAGFALFGRQNVGWGAGFLDIDRDGWEDLFLGTGHCLRFPKTSPLAQRPILARNIGNGKFMDITARGGPYFNVQHRGRGAVLADFDNDGCVDLVVVHQNEPVALLRNEADRNGNHWLGVELVGKNHRDVVGARIVLESGGRTQTRFAQGGGSYLSNLDRRHVFGLGRAERVDKLIVIWPSGKKQRWTNLTVDRYHRLMESGK